MISDFYPKAIGAVVNNGVVAERENGQVKHRGGASKANFYYYTLVGKVFGGCAKFRSRNH